MSRRDTAAASSEVSLPTARDHVRAVVITLHLAAVVLMAAPTPSKLSKRDLADPLMKDALGPVAQLMGMEVEDPEFIELAVESTGRFRELRSTVLAPFQPYYRYAGTRQSWQMFGAVTDTPARVEILLDHGDGSLAPLYVARSPEHTWRRHQLDQERFRAFMNDYSWQRDKRSWGFFTEWVARQAAADFPEAERLVMRVRRMPIVSAAELRAAGGERPLGKTFWTTQLRLGDYRDEPGSDGASGVTP